jgi:ubiquitin-protein ligase E3 C
LANVIPLEWLQMFNNKELQVLISGAQIPVDVEDLKQHTNYSGGYASDHPTIRLFWKVCYVNLLLAPASDEGGTFR